MKRLVIIIYMCLSACVGTWAQDSIFVDAHLKTLIHEALQQNSDIRVAALNVKQASAMMKSAKLTYLPSFAFSPSGTLSKAQGSSWTKTYSLPLTMEWELLLGGGQKGEKQMATAQWMQAQEELRHLQVQLIAEVANSYYTLVMLDRQLDITQESIRNQESNLNAIRAYMEVGQMDALAVNQANAALQATKTSLTDLELQRTKVETALSLLLNREASHIERSAWEEVQTISLDPSAPIELQQLSSRPDVRSAEYALAAACGNAKVTQSALYTSLRISADAGWTNNLGQIINPGKLLLNLIGSLTQPIFSRGKLLAQKKVADAQREQAEISFEKALLTAGSEVKDALEECASCQRREPLRTQQVEASQKAYEDCQALLQYSQSVTYLDVLTAQSSLLTAQLQQSADWLEQQQALINLYKAMCPAS